MLSLELAVLSLQQFMLKVIQYVCHMAVYCKKKCCIHACSTCMLLQEDQAAAGEWVHV